MKKTINVIGTNFKENKHRWEWAIVLSLSFIIPAVLTALAYWMQNIYPGSEETILIYDLFAQYMPFYASLRNMFTGGNSLHFNWSCSLGGNYLGLFTYYLSSPITWLLALCDLKSLPDGIYYVTLLRFGLCGLSMAAFLLFAPREKRVALKALETTEDRSNPIITYVGILLLSTSYALMSYMFMYGMSLMWIDVVILLPIVIWGLELLLEGKNWLYTLAVFSSLFCNYYIAYMVMIFSGLFFIGLLFIEWETVCSSWKRIVTKYIVGNVIAIGLDAPFLCATIAALKQGKTGTLTVEYNKIINHNPLRILVQVMPQQYDSIKNSGLPSIFCGLVVLLLAVAFFVLNRGLKERVVSLLLLILLYLSFLIKPLDYIWHGFRPPVCYPHRYSFLWCFMIIYCAYRGYFFLLKKQFNRKKVFISLMCTYTILELLFNGASLIAEHNVSINYAYRYKIDGSINQMYDISNIMEGNGYDSYDRMEKSGILTNNDPLLFNYHGLIYSSSVFNQRLLNLFKSLGILQYESITIYRGATPVTDSLFGIRYIFILPDASSLYTPIDDRYSIYENPYSLGIGVVSYVHEDGNNIVDFHEEDNPFKVQNAIAASIIGDNGFELFEGCSVNMETFNNGVMNGEMEDADYQDNSSLKDNEARITATIKSDGPLYLAINFTDLELFMLRVQETDRDKQFIDIKQGDLELEVDGKKIQLPENTIYYPRNFYLGDFKKGETVDIRIAGYTFPRDIYLASLNADKMQKWYGELVSRKVIVDSDVISTDGTLVYAISSILMGSTVLQGDVDIDSEGTLVISLPYDIGYKVYIDNTEVETKSYADALLSADMPSGQHSIIIKYTAPGWNIGLFIWFLTVIGIVSSMVMSKTHRKNARFLDEVL